MIEPNIDVWFVEQARTDFNRQRLGETFAQDGMAGVKELIVETASRDISEMISGSASCVLAFNEVSTDWPHKARALLAAYEYYEQDRDDDTYMDDLERFVESENIPESEIFGGQTSLRMFFDANPYEDDRLSEAQADAVMVLRADGADIDEEQLLEVEDVERFVERYYSLNDVSAALHAHHFDTDIPDETLSELADPDEWPDDMDPGNVESHTCVYCGNGFSEVYANGERQVAGHRSMEVTGYSTVGDELHVVAERNGTILCDNCYDDWESRAWQLTYSDGDRNETVVAEYNNGVLRDASGSFAAATSFEQANGETQDSTLDCSQSPNPDGYFQFEVSSTFGDVSQINATVREVIAPPTPVSSGSFFATDNGDSVTVYLPREDATAVRQFKEALNERVNAVDEQDETEEGLGELFG
jgi:hypothetical protein